MSPSFRSGRCALLIALCPLVAQGLHAADKTADAGATFAVIRTNVGERFEGRLAAIDATSVRIATDKEHALALEDVEAFTLRPARPVLHWHGQDNQDHAQPGAAEGGNGIQDIHLRLEHMPLDRKFKEVRVLVELMGGRQEWSSTNTSDGRWKLIVKEERTDASMNASLFFEPPSVDVYNLSFTVQVAMDDDSKHELRVKANSKTSSRRKVGEAEESDASSASDLDAWLTTRDGGRIRGKLARIVDDIVTLQTRGSEDSKIPLAFVQSIEFGSPDSDEEQQKRSQLLSASEGKDQVLLRTKESSLRVIAGSVTGLEDGKLLLTFEDKPRKLSLERVLGLVMAQYGGDTQTTELTLAFHLNSEEIVVGTVESQRQESLAVKTGWQQTVKIHPNRIRRVVIRNGRVVYLSDLEPVDVEETPYFRRVWNYRRNESLSGKPLRMGEKEFTKGLAVHSRCVLSYALDDAFNRFRCVVGFDKSAANRGRVDCRVWVDDREEFSTIDLRADGKPVEIDISVREAQSLRLEVDFGSGEDVGDRIIWGSPRLYRAG